MEDGTDIFTICTVSDKFSFNRHFFWAEKFINQRKEIMINYEVKEWGTFKNG
jgi:hypothetical protein